MEFLKKNVITVSRSPSKAGRLAQRRLMAAACPTLAPNCLLHLRLAFFCDEDSPPNGSNCSLAQRNWHRCCAKMAADITHVTTHFYCTA